MENKRWYKEMAVYQIWPRPFCAVTYKSFVRALAQNKVKRVDDYRLARARFAA